MLTTIALAIASFATPVRAIDFGPEGMFSLTGFAEFTVGQQGNYCMQCQVADSSASKQIQASDAVAPGKSFGNAVTSFWQFQPFLGVNKDLGNGYKLVGLLSQRWRDGAVDGRQVEARYGGKVDVPGYWYEKNIGLSHEEYGSVRIGAMTTRAWSVADFPYATNVGLSSAWASSGAGYGMLANAIRLGSRPLDFAEGDLYVELTYDRGDTNFTRLKPSFYELYAQYHKGDLVVDAMYQSATNGGPGAWGHAPFSGVSPFAADDGYVNPGNGTTLTSNKQSIAMVMGRYEYTTQLQFSGGVRRNSWSGANVVYNPATNWTTAFNVDYSNPFATSNPGYGATSTDVLLGARYRMGKWVLSTGMVHFGKAETDNPSERGQSNSALLNTIGAQYEVAPRLSLEATAGAVKYALRGLSPMSMPSNEAFSNVDSRVTTSGRWLTVGMIYVF
jgi:predicted porin